MLSTMVLAKLLLRANISGNLHTEEKPRPLCNLQTPENLKEQKPLRQHFRSSSGLFLTSQFLVNVVDLICICSPVTSDFLCGLVLHFSVTQLKQNCCYDVGVNISHCLAFFSSELVVFFAMLDFAECPEAFLHKIERKNIWLIFHCS